MIMKNYFKNKWVAILFLLAFSLISLILFLILLISKLHSKEIVNNNRSLILVIGDGMGLPIISAWDYYKKDSIDDNYSVLEDFDGSFLVRTRSKDKVITDSAAAATAYSTGYNVDNYQVGVLEDNKRVKTIMDLAKENNKSTGIVVLCTLTHATPAAFYAYASKRSEEQQIANYLLYSNIDVAIGGGHKYFKNLIPKFKQKGYTILENIYEINELKNNNLKRNKISKLLAFLHEKHPPKQSQRNYKLSDLSELAINILSKNKNGFFLMIEASQIDWYGHDNLFKDQLNEMKDYEETLKFLLNKYKNDNNVMILTLGDHDCGGLTLIDYNASKFDDNFKINYSSNYHTAEHIPAFYKGTINYKIKPIVNNIEVFHIMKDFLLNQ
ncbi:MAG: alkaline phosphatase [bacterium]